MPQEVLDDVQIALGLPHQVSSNRMPETVRAHVDPKLSTERRVEMRELIHIHRSAHMPLRELVHVEELLGGTNSSCFGIEEQNPQMFGELAVDRDMVLIKVF